MRWNEKIAHMRRGAEIIQQKLTGDVSPGDLGATAVNADEIAKMARDIIATHDPDHGGSDDEYAD